MQDKYDSLSYKFHRWFQWTWLGKTWYDVRVGIPNLWKWRKVVWNDRDWDSHYIFAVLKFKLENTANRLEKNNITASSSTDVFWMRVCVRLIDKIMNDKYESEYYNYRKLKHKFGKSDKNGSREMKIETIENNLNKYIKLYPLWYKRAVQHIKDNPKKYTKTHKDELLQSIVIGHLRDNKAKEILFKIIRDKISGWWD